MSYVTCHISPVTCLLSTITNANPHSHRSSHLYFPTMHSMLVCKEENKRRKKKKNNSIQQISLRKKCVLISQYKRYNLWPEVFRPQVAWFPGGDNIQQTDIATYRLNPEEKFNFGGLISLVWVDIYTSYVYDVNIFC